MNEENSVSPPSTNEHKKKRRLRIASVPKFSKRSITLFGIVFVALGSFFLYRALAYTTTVTYSGKIVPPAHLTSYTLTTGSGQISIRFKSKSTDAYVKVKDKAGNTIGKIQSTGYRRGARLQLSALPDTYTFVVGTDANITSPIYYSLTISYPLRDSKKPSAIITSPQSGDSVSKTVSFAATATDDVGVTKVEFFVGTTLLSTDASVPFKTTWDTTKLPNGPAALSIKSYDAAGNVGTASATVQVNNTIVVAPAPTPTPTPAPTPSPTPTPTPAPIPTTSGSIASNFDVAQFLAGAVGGPVESSAYEPSGNFRFTCAFSHLSYDDPIVYPGQPGLSHLHMYFGNKTTNANSTYQSLRTSGDGTCDGGPVNRSGYWIPAVMNASNKVVVPQFVSVYYKGPGSDASGKLVDVVSMDGGLRMIAGYNMSAPSGNTGFEWYCEKNQVKQQTIPHCASNELVGVHLTFPTCWNGQLDSPDHRSHLAYQVRNPDTGKMYCPSGYNKQIPRFELGVWFKHDGASEKWYLSSDRMPGMTHANGSTFHSDWFGAWDPTIMNTWISKCINGLLNCKGGEIGDGRSLKGKNWNADGSYGFYTGPMILDAPAMP